MYSGDTFHGQPLFLHLYRFLLSPGIKEYLNIFFIALDVLTSCILVLSSYCQLMDMIEWETGQLGKLNRKDMNEIGMNASKILGMSVKVGILYLLNPFSILCCVGRSIGVIDNFLVSLLLLSAITNQRMISCLVAALLTYQCLHCVVLIIPVFMILEQQRVKERIESNSSHESTGTKKKNTWLSTDFSVNYSCKTVWFSILWSFIIFCTFFIALLVISFHVMNQSWDFMNNTVYFLLSVPDLTPNIGMFWYFFTEMFDHFRTFFLCVFQINSILYAIPLAVTLKGNPYFLFLINLILLTILKPYPSVSDIAMYFSLIPQFSHLVKFMKQGLIVSSTIVTCCVLMPILWHLWIMMASANSNFYFGVTLALNTAEILLVTDLLFAFTKRQYYLKHGIPRDENQQPKRLELVYE